MRGSASTVTNCSVFCSVASSLLKHCFSAQVLISAVQFCMQGEQSAHRRDPFLRLSTKQCRMTAKIKFTVTHICVSQHTWLPPSIIPGQWVYLRRQEGLTVWVCLPWRPARLVAHWTLEPDSLKWLHIRFTSVSYCCLCYIVLTHRSNVSKELSVAGLFERVAPVCVVWTYKHGRFQSKWTVKDSAVFERVCQHWLWNGKTQNRGR